MAETSRPAPMPVQADKIPAELTMRRQWVCWPWTWNGKKWDKPPKRVDGTPASSTDPKTWTSFPEALEAHMRGRFDGVGFVFNQDFVGIDLDNCRNPETGELSATAEYIVHKLDSYAEVSPSGTGVKIFCKGTIPNGRKANHAAGVEMYQSGRYFTATGNQLPGTPSTINARQDAINEIHRLFLESQKSGRQKSEHEETCESALSALDALNPARADAYADWLAVGMALHSLDSSLLSAWEKWSERSDKFQIGECARKWESFNGGGVGIASLFYWAKQDGWKPPQSSPRNGQASGPGNQKIRKPQRTRQPLTKRLIDVHAVPLKWLWPNRIPSAKLSMISGNPGLGKSFLTCQMAATVSRGWDWPDGTPCRQGSVVLMNAEDDLADTIRPRLDAAGADVSRVFSLVGIQETIEDETQQKHFSLVDHLAVLEDMVKSIGDVRLITIDPIAAYLAQTDSHKDGDVRGTLAPLSEIASKYDLAILYVMHLNKMRGGTALQRSTGSTAFAAAARAVWFVGKAFDDPKRRLFLPVKNNLSEEVSGLAFSIIDGVVAWESEPVPFHADDLLAEEMDDPEEKAAKSEAEEWLADYLSNGVKPAIDAKREAKKAGFSDKQIRTARMKICKKPWKSGFGEHSRWMWELSEKLPKNSRLSKTGILGSFDDDEGTFANSDSEQDGNLLGEDGWPKDDNAWKRASSTEDTQGA